MALSLFPFLLLLSIIFQQWQLGSAFLLTKSKTQFGCPPIRYSVEVSSKDGGVINVVETVKISQPRIKYSLPDHMNIGWRDESGQWWDGSGKREGPPKNYWRQSMDERDYEKDIRIIDAVLNGKMEEVEGDLQLSVRNPSLNRLQLGTWAPIVRSGKIEASIVEEEGKEFFVPYTVKISRPDGRKLGPKTPYGVFDLHLEEGEDIRVESLEDGISFVVKAIASNDSRSVGNIGGAPMLLGGIKYLSKYLMVTENDVWMRLDEEEK